jgi:hypothetical protein
MKKYAIAALVLLSGCVALKKESKVPLVREGPGEIVARAVASYPSEVKDETQASMLACQGATANAQAAILDRILMKQTPSGKTLAEAEVPNIELQRHVRTMVSSAQVIQTSVHDKACAVTIAISKPELRAILKEGK